MAKYVYSTLTAPQLYRGASGDVVRVEGGANSPDRFMRTPRGVATRITEAQAAVLESSNLFKRHRARGFVEISAKQADAESVAKSLAGPDKSAPDTEEKLKQEGKESPSNKGRKK